MKRRQYQLDIYPTTGDGLYNFLCDIWNELSKKYFPTLSDSMVNRCKILKNVRGRSTKY